MSTLPTLEVEQTVRLSCRVSPRIKRQVEEAATYLGQSITDFTEVALKVTLAPPGTVTCTWLSPAPLPSV